MYLVKLIWEVNDDVREQIQVAKDHFNKERFWKQTEILEIKETINQIKNSIEGITNRLDHLEDRTSGNVDKIYNFEKRVDHREQMLRNHE